MNNEVVYVVTIEGKEKEILGICGSIKEAYNLVKEEVSLNWDNYFKYCKEGEWRRITYRTLSKSYKFYNVRKYFEESDDDYEQYDFLITRWEVM